MMATLSDLAKSLPPPGTAAAAAPAGGGGAAAQALKAQAAGAPKLIARIATTLAGGTSALRGEAARQALIAAYNGPDGPGTLCGPAVTGRYPFSRGATDAIPLGDFARLFGPGGLFDGFFKQQLAPFVTTSGGTWHTQEVDGVTAPISPADLAQFQRASTIRQLFFAGGPGGPSVSFSLKPHDLDDKSQQATLTLGSSTTITASHSLTLPTQIMWPGSTGMELARLQFTPGGSGTGVLQAEGPWALFRLIDQGLLSPKSANQYDVTFATADHHVSFSIEAGSVQNPFSHSVLQSFSCPRIQ
jgi:type VI secretion system protein ImpL